MRSQVDLAFLSRLNRGCEEGPVGYTATIQNGDHPESGIFGAENGV